MTLTIAGPIDPKDRDSLDAAEIAIEVPDQGRIVRASGFHSPGETVALEREGGKVRSVRLAGSRLLDADAMRAEMEERYGGKAVS